MANVLGLFRNAEKVRALPAGATILEPGTPPTCMYVVRHRQLTVRIDGETIDTVGEGGLVGERSLIDDGERSATVEALTDRELVPVDQWELMFLVQQTYFAIDVMRVSTGRLRAANRRAAGR